MTNLLFLIPVALFLGAIGMTAFIWSLKSGQYDDLDGAAVRILGNDEAEPDQESVSQLVPYSEPSGA
jgi:cbb3-type cytochrome oxidase maturation protein